jgi:hypothetical protein
MRAWPGPRGGVGLADCTRGVGGTAAARRAVDGREVQLALLASQDMWHPPDFGRRRLVTVGWEGRRGAAAQAVDNRLGNEQATGDPVHESPVAVLVHGCDAYLLVVAVVIAAAACGAVAAAAA